jgi:hypothetical protein
VNETVRIVRHLRRHGLTVEGGGQRHWKVRDAAGRIVAVMPTTPSRHANWRRVRGDLRRAGILLPDPK